MTDNATVIAELTRVKVLFQQRAVVTHLGFDPRRLTQPDEQQAERKPYRPRAVIGEAGFNHHTEIDRG